MGEWSRRGNSFGDWSICAKREATPWCCKIAGWPAGWLALCGCSRREMNSSRDCCQIAGSISTADRPTGRTLVESLEVGTGESRYLDWLVTRAFFSSWGDDAIWAAAHEEWNREDYPTAKRLWQRLLPAGNAPVTEPRYPDSSFSPAEITARLILCDIFSGEIKERQSGSGHFLQTSMPKWKDRWAVARVAGRNCSKPPWNSPRTGLHRPLPKT